MLISGPVYVLVEVAEEVDVRVEADAYAVDKDDRKASGGGVRTVPVREMRDWRALCRSESNWAKGEEREEAAQRFSVETIAMATEADVGEEVDEANALGRR